MLMKSVLSAVLVVLGACNGAPTGHVVASAEAPSVLPTPAAAVSESGGPVAAKTIYVCPMHQDVVSEKPGVCPKCNMTLEPKLQAL